VCVYVFEHQLLYYLFLLRLGTASGCRSASATRCVNNRHRGSNVDQKEQQHELR